MKTKLSILIISLLTFSSFAQSIDKEVIASAGGSLSNATNKLIVTIGEPIVGIVSNGITVSQGFLAGASISNVLAVDEQLLSNAIRLFPNPVQEYLNIDLTDVVGTVKLMLYTTTGKQLLVQKLDKQHNTINIGHLPQGLYLVNLQFSNYKNLKSFKILKK